MDELAPPPKKQATGINPEDEQKFQALWQYLHVGGYYAKVDIDDMMPSEAYMDANPKKKWALAMFAHDHAAQLLAEAHEVLTALHKENPSACTPACPHNNTCVHLCGCPQTKGCAQCDGEGDDLGELKELLKGLQIPPKAVDGLLSEVSRFDERGAGAKESNSSFGSKFS